MKFKQAVKKTPNLEGAWCAGLGALRAQDKPHIKVETPRHLAGSVDVDAALQKVEPHAHRWDFAIAYKHTNLTAECVYWVEIHTASDSEVKVVLDKLKWLKDWLAKDNNLLDDFEREICWVSSGETTFTLNAPQKKRFAQLGLRHCGRILRILDKRI